MRKQKRERELKLQQPLIPREVWPDPTAVNACSICTSFPVGLKVVREKEFKELENHISERIYLITFIYKFFNLLYFLN
jgi:hypothetical protein